MDDHIKERLIDIVGQENFTDQLIDMVSYSYDASHHDHRPSAALWPTHSDQISKIMTMANEHRFPIIPRGAGTGLSGAAVPITGGLVLDLCRMNNILDIRIADRMVVVQPGVVYANLQKALAPMGFFYPPDPASGKACTLGGNVATNAGGLKGAKYGTTKDYVMGLEVVLPDGRIMRTGSGCMKTSSGFDLTRLFVGSEGALGIITEITLKISAKPTASMTGLAYFSSLEEAGKAVSDIIQAGIVPSVLELLDNNCLDVLREHAEMNLPDAMAMILVETDGYSDAEVSFPMERVITLFKENGAIKIQRADSPEEVEELWRARLSVGTIASRLGTRNVSEDVTVPVSRVPELLTGISGIASTYGLPFIIFGHAGDGNLHPKIMYDIENPDHVSRLNRAVEEIFKLTCDLGGTLTGEHGIGLEKASFMSMEHDPVALHTMHAIKKLFDPNNVLNPGKMNFDNTLAL